MTPLHTPRDLGNGFVLRHATVQDTDALVEMQIHAFANPDTGEPDIYLGGWTRNLMGGKHPTFRPEDFLIAVETATGKIVSCVCLISQTWNMGGVSFPVGRVEIVGTHADYRRRGLVRELFRVLHEISAQRGELLQSITGIPYYYRQFGYEYAIELPAYRQTFIPQQLPNPGESDSEKYRLRHAEQVDFAFVSDTYKLAAHRSLVHCERDAAMFEYEHLLENETLNGTSSWWDIIETLDSSRVGILCHRRYVYQGRHTTVCYEIVPPFEWHDVTPFLMRELARQAGKLEIDDKKPLSSLGWILATDHPLFSVAASSMDQGSGAYAWYIRVPDLPAFMTKIAPVLEKRLAASDLRNYSGELALNFYRNGLSLKFENGKLLSSQEWRSTAGDYGQKGFGNATFPNLTFLKLLFGYRSRSELQEMYPDFTVDTDKNKALLDALFPKRPTNIIPIH